MLNIDPASPETDQALAWFDHFLEGYIKGAKDNPDRQTAFVELVNVILLAQHERGCPASGIAAAAISKIAFQEQ